MVQLAAEVEILFGFYKTVVTGEASALYRRATTCLEILAEAPTNILKSNTVAFQRVSFTILIRTLLWQHFGISASVDNEGLLFVYLSLNDLFEVIQLFYYCRSVKQPGDGE